MARKLRPWILHNRRLRKLPSAQQSLHDALVQWSALFVPDALAEVDANALFLMTERGETYIHPTPFGEVVILGPEGRLRAGKDPDKRPSTDAALNNAYMFRAISELTHLGYIYRNQHSRALHRLTSPESRGVLMAGQARGLAPRTIRRLVRVQEVEMLRRGMNLLLVVPDLRTVSTIQAKHAALIRLHLVRLARDRGEQFMLRQAEARAYARRQQYLDSKRKAREAAQLHPEHPSAQAGQHDQASTIRTDQGLP